MRYCVACGNPIYDNKKKYCSKKCKRKMKRHRKLNRLYFNEKTRKWEQLN